MGRELRRVPCDWEHPEDQGCYKPVYDHTYTAALADYRRLEQQWDNEEYPEELYSKYTFEEYEGPGPNPELCRPEFKSPADCYQIYENVTEGTPVSPVFQTLDELRDWCTAEGWTNSATDDFIEYGYQFTLIVTIPRGNR